MKKLSLTIAAAAASVALLATSASAAVTFDPATGQGFVGKGDVQTALGWNNKQLQDGAGSVQFSYSAVTEQETSWTCVNEHNNNVQERSRTTTTEVSGVASHIARERNQITGFNLTGFTGGTSSSTSTDGPPLNSCPNANSTYQLGSTETGAPVVVGGGLFVNGVPLN